MRGGTRVQVPGSLVVFVRRLRAAGYACALPLGSRPPASGAPYFCGVFVSTAFSFEAPAQTPYACGSEMHRDLLSVTVVERLPPATGDSRTSGTRDSCSSSSSSSSSGVASSTSGAAAGSSVSRRVRVFTSHLESGAGASALRVRQLLEATGAMLRHTKGAPGEACIFGYGMETHAQARTAVPLATNN